MTGQVRADLGFADRRRFHFIEYRYGHTQALLRGIPEPDSDDDEEGAAEDRVIDFLFVNVARISCWKDFRQFEIRRPTASEMATLRERVPGLRSDDSVFLLEAGTIESYIVAGRVYWAEFDVGRTGESPLVSEDQDYRESNPPIMGVVHFAD